MLMMVKFGKCQGNPANPFAKGSSVIPLWLPKDSDNDDGDDSNDDVLGGLPRDS